MFVAATPYRELLLFLDGLIAYYTGIVKAAHCETIIDGAHAVAEEASQTVGQSVPRWIARILCATTTTTMLFCDHGQRSGDVDGGNVGFAVVRCRSYF